MSCLWIRSSTSVHTVLKNYLYVSFTDQAVWVIILLLKDTIVSYITLNALFQAFPKGLRTLIFVLAMRLGLLGLCNECYRVWSLSLGWMLQGVESLPWLNATRCFICVTLSLGTLALSLSNRFSAMYENRLNPFGDDEDALSDTPRTPSSAGSFRNHRAKYLSTLCSPFLSTKNTVCSLELQFA